jgi:hypothetical protein
MPRHPIEPGLVDHIRESTTTWSAPAVLKPCLAHCPFDDIENDVGFDQITRKSRFGQNMDRDMLTTAIEGILHGRLRMFARIVDNSCHDSWHDPTLLSLFLT